MFDWFTNLFTDGTNAVASDVGAAAPSSTGYGVGIGAFFGDTLASFIKPLLTILLPVLVILLIVYIFASVVAKKVVP